ncbi:MAG: hypothetical protein ACLVJ6_09215 [Merdibacter sp.]
MIERTIREYRENGLMPSAASGYSSLPVTMKIDDDRLLGGMGVWKRNVATVYVRPQRYQTVHRRQRPFSLCFLMRAGAGSSPIWKCFRQR